MELPSSPLGRLCVWVAILLSVSNKGQGFRHDVTSQQVIR